jgi:hypothetical protein
MNDLYFLFLIAIGLMVYNKIYFSVFLLLSCGLTFIFYKYFKFPFFVGAMTAFLFLGIIYFIVCFYLAMNMDIKF